MTTSSIATARLQLHPCTIGHVTALIADDHAFERAFGWRVMPGYLEFPQALEYMRDHMPDDPRWGSYLFIHAEDRALIGLGGYKGKPDAEGMVEIGYGVADVYRNQGYASEAARGLIAFAFEQVDVQKVWAHTLAEPNASTHVLAKSGMSRIAELDDPEDGRLWRWELLR